MESSHISQSEYLKVFETLPKVALAQIFEATTGERAGNMPQNEILHKLNQLGQEKFVDGVVSLPFSDKVNISKQLTENNSSLFTEFTKEHYLHP